MIIQEKGFDPIQDLVALPSGFLQYEAEQPRLAVGSPGKHAVANLTFTKFGDKTHLTDVYTELPAKMLRELYYDPYLPGLPYILFMNPTGGIVQGDRYFYKFHLNEGAEAFITDTMATKIYKMDLNYASKQVDVYLSKNSRLEFFPRETIAFGGSRWCQNVVFHVSEGSKFLCSEIFCPGRIARGEFWDFDIYASKLIIEENGRLLLLDSSIFTRQDKDVLDVIFGSNKYLLKAYWYSENAAAVANKINFKEVYGGVTEMAEKRGLTIKALSNDLNDLRKIQTELWSIWRKTEAGTQVPQLRMY
jgi:urease accessory protein